MQNLDALAASRLQIIPEWPPVACKLYPCGRQLHATWIKLMGICMQLAATRVQFACNWRPFGYHLYATGRQTHPNFASKWRPLGNNLYATGASRIQFLHPSGGPSGTICLRLAFKSATELNDSLMVYMNYFMTFFTTPCIKLFCDSREEG